VPRLMRLFWSIGVFALGACGASPASEAELPAPSTLGACLDCHSPPEAAVDAETKTVGIAGTHFDNWWRDASGALVYTDTAPLEGMLLEAPLDWATEGLGYVTRSSPNACSASCHEGHSHGVVIALEWARSKHADSQSAPYTHVFTDPVCSRCHSAAGFAAYVDASNLAYPQWTLAGVVPQGYHLTCNGCHDALAYPTADAPHLRREGVVPLVSGNGTSFVVDGVVSAGRSAVCVSCHQARESGATLYRAMRGKNADPYDAVAQVMTGFNLPNPHYRGAAAFLYGYKGFELPGRAYTPGNAFHQSIGCVGCHMVRDEGAGMGGHTLLMRDQAGQDHISVCRRCHGPVNGFTEIGLLRDLDGDGVAKRPALELEALKATLLAALATAALYYDDATYPYFFTDPLVHGDATRARTWTEAQAIAAFNFLLVAKDPGAFAHNFRYATQLLRDAYAGLLGHEPSGERPATADDRPATIFTAP